jgi:hypothetical protein
MANHQRSAEKEAYWRTHVEGQAVGDVSVREYCLRFGLSEPSFYCVFPASLQSLKIRRRRWEPGCVRLSSVGLAWTAAQGAPESAGLKARPACRLRTLRRFPAGRRDPAVGPASCRPPSC